MRQLIAKSRRTGAGLGQDPGFVYSGRAFVPNDSELPTMTDPINDYEPSTRPGSRAPHLWIENKGVKISTLDLFRGAFVLLAGTDYSSKPLNTSGMTVLQSGKIYGAGLRRTLRYRG